MALSLLNTNEVQVVRVVKALYNAAPGNVYLTNFVGYANAFSVSALATTLAKDFAANDNATLAASVAANLGLTGSALTAGTAYLTAEFGKAGADRGVVILNAVNALSNLTADATYGAAATAFNDSVATGLAYSTNSANTSTDLATLQAASIPTGNTVDMVAGTDNLTGSSRGDTFKGTLNSTLTSVDKINGAAGNDVLKATLSTVTDTVQPLAITDVETVIVTGVGTTAANTLSVKYATGLTLLQFDDVTTTGAVGRVYKITDITSPSIGLKVSNVTSGDTTVNFTHDAAGLTGTADTVNLTLQDVGSSTTKVGAVQVDTAGIEGLTVASNGTGNYIDSLATGGDVKSLTISGAAPLTVTTLTGANSKLVAIDASAATGAVNIDTSYAANIKVTGGAGNDTFVFGANLDVNDTVDGGAGTNTVSVDAAIATNVTLTNIQTLSLKNGIDAVLSQSNLAGITTVVGTADTAGEENAFTEATPGKHSVVSLATDAAATVSYALKSTLDTTNDSLNVTVGSSAVDGTTRGIFTANTVETLNLTSASKTATTANTLAQLNAQKATVVNLSGTALTITALDLADEHTINASAMTGVLTMNTTADDETIIGGSANDAITFDTYSELTSSDSIDGGAGNDTVTVATNGTGAAAYGRVAMTNVENLNLTIDVDSGTSSTHTIDLRNAPVSTFKISTTGASAGNNNTDSITVSNIQAGTTKIALHVAAEDMAAGTYTFDSDRNTNGNLVLTGAAGTNLNGTTIATTGDWQSFAIKQTASSSTDAHTLAFSAETGLTSLSVDATEQAMTFSSISASKLASLTITGDNAVTVTALSQTTAALSNVDASASSAAITLTATTRTSAATVTTGSGDDAIELTLGTEAGNTINAGTNTTVASSSTGDTLNLNGTATGSNVIDLSSTTDQVTTINGVANAATQIGFEHVSASGTSVAGGTFSITGSSGINVITGGAGNDTIDGGAGNDTITGGGGVDVLTGGSGNDTFMISATAAGNGVDQITDFQTGLTSGAADKLNATALAAFLNGATTAIKAITATDTAGSENDNFLTIATDVGTYADAAAMKTALASGGLITFGSGIAAADAHVLIAYTSSVSGNVRIAEATIANDGGIASAADLVELVGVTAYTGFVAGNIVMD